MGNTLAWGSRWAIAGQAMRRLLGLCFLVLLVVATGACAGAPGTAVFVRASLVAKRFTLANGLDVVLHPDATFRSVAVNVRYDVGSRHDPRNASGLAHLVEHLTFRGKPDGASDAYSLLEAAGSASHNASTSMDATEYYATVPADQLPLALFIEAARMARPLDGVDEEVFAAERSVVQNERRERVDNVSYGNLDLRAVYLLFEGDAYGIPTIGLEQDIGRLSLASARRFVSSYYRPNNATLVIAGAFDPVRTTALVHELFDAIPAAPVPRTRIVPDPSSTKNVHQVMATGVDAPAVALAWSIPAAGARGWHEMLLARRAVPSLTRRQLGSSVRKIRADVVSMEAASVFLVHAELEPNTRAEKLIDAVGNALAMLVDERYSELLGTEKSRLIADRTLALEALEDRAHVLQSFIARYDYADSIQSELHEISTVRYDDFTAAITRYLQKGRRVSVVASPTANAPKAGWWKP